jgi:hypothetical protein
LLLAGALWTVPCTPVTAQEVFVVAGRVLDAEVNRGVPNAVVTLEGHRPILTGATGDFRFPEVEEGEYVLRVEAFGYRASSRSLRVRNDVTVAVELGIAPFVLDSLVVAPREVEVNGRVRDQAKDLSLKDVDVFTSRGEAVRTNGRGRFEVRGWEGIGLLLQVRAFGYLPLDTVVAPEPGGTFELDVEPDPLVERMIEAEIRRIEDRAGGRRAITMRPLDRDDLLRRGGSTLLELLRTEYGQRVRLGCVILDERSLTPAMADGVIRTMLAQDVERIEFLFRGRMLRIYTREFMRTMLGGGIELAVPTYVDMARPPFCT